MSFVADARCLLFSFSPEHDSSRDRSRSRSRRRHRRHRHSSFHDADPSSHAGYRSPPPPSRSSRPRHPMQGRCWACGGQPLPEKLVCSSCLAEATSEVARQKDDVVGLIKQVVRDSLQEFSASLEGPGASAAVPSVSASAAEQPIAGGLSDCEEEDDPQEEGDPSVFDFGLIEPFVSAVRRAIRWEDEESLPEKKGKYSPQLRKKRLAFPLMEEIKELVLEEWRKVERRLPFQNRLAKLYPLLESDAALFDSFPIIDASVMRLVRNTTLPLEDAVSFRDVLDRRIDQDLKKAYLAAGAACKPMVALTSISRAMKVWVDDLEAAVKRDPSPSTVLPALDELRLSADFLAEVAIDSLRCSARAMLFSITAKRALWLKPWSADPTSKQSWCRIPFDGKALFGDKLDTAISRVTGGKSGLIPQDRSRKRKFFARSGFPQRFKDARAYRPGRDFKRNWRGAQSSFLRAAKSRTTGQAREQPKSF